MLVEPATVPKVETNKKECSAAVKLHQRMPAPHTILCGRAAEDGTP